MTSAQSIRDQRPVLNNVLTALWFVGAVLTVYSFTATVEETKEFLAAFSSILLIMYASRRFFTSIAPLLMIKERQKVPANVQKFRDQGFQLVQHVVLTLLGLIIILDSPWWDDAWTRLPNSSNAMRLSRMLYMFEMISYSVSGFTHRFIEAPHKDYFVMFAHHVITVGLMAGSFLDDKMSIGVVILFLHDLSDIPTDLLKMSNYLGWDGAKGFFMTEVSFISLVVSWPLIRMYWFPQVILQSFNSRDNCQPETHGYWTGPGISYNCWALRTSLLILACMHVYWYYLMLRILYKILKGVDPSSAGDEEYEGDAHGAEHSNDDAAKKKKGPAKNQETVAKIGTPKIPNGDAQKPKNGSSQKPKKK